MKETLPASTITHEQAAMATRSIIRRQMNRSGNILLGSVEPMPDADFYRECVNGISVAWTLGHLACVHDLFRTFLCGSTLQLSEEMHAVFNSLDIGGPGGDEPPSKAETVDPDVYSKDDLIGHFRLAQVNNLRLLDAFDVGRWREPTPPHGPDSLPTLGSIWESLGVHTFWHLGELSAAHPAFRGTYSLNTVVHYFYTGGPSDAGDCTADEGGT